MKENFKSFFRKNIRRKRFWIILGLLVIVVAYLIFKPSSSVKNTVTDIAKLSDLKQTVLATGQVVSNTDLNLSFNTSGVVKSLKVKIGDTVKAGQVLATLDQGKELAALTSARGSLAAANARYRRTLEGASNEEISLSQITLNQTKLTQDTLVKNAYNSLLNSSLEATSYPPTTTDTSLPAISGTYNLGKEGQIIIEVGLSGRTFKTHGLITTDGDVSTTSPQPIGNSGLYIQFPSDLSLVFTEWVVEIPNKKAANYLANYNAYQAALAQAKLSVDQREAELAIKKSAARSSDIELANAEILSAEGQVQSAQAQYNNTIITAPVDGTITSIDIKIGQLAQAQTRAMVLQDVSNIYIEANINEANISELSIGMPIDITYDSFGSDKIFKGSITKIDPSSTIISGVVNYKVTASTEQLSELRPGMTANMTIKVKEKSNIITAPSRSVITDDNGDRSIRVITNERKKKWGTVPVITGLEGDGGVVEIVKGLSVGDEYVILIKQ